MPESEDTSQRPAGGSAAAYDEFNDPRVYLAAERTLLSWIRTGLALMGFGFVVARFSLFMHEIAATLPKPPRQGLSIWFGTALVLLGVLVNVFAGLQHYQIYQRLRRREPLHPGGSPVALLLALLLAVVGLLMAVYLIRMK